MNIIKEIKRKREFSMLPDSIVERVAEMMEGDVKKSRALLRKYFGVFLTNKILKGKLSSDEILIAHMSSRKRDYKKFYGEIFSGMQNIGSVIDLGCGVNGFSYSYLRDAVGARAGVPSDEGNVDYVGVEGAGQLVEHMNRYFESEGFSARAVVGDLFDIEGVLKILKRAHRSVYPKLRSVGAKKDRVVFLFQVIDALENLERDFSKKFILEISEECEKIVLSLSTESLGGRKKFAVRRKWIFDFLEENFAIEKDFVMSGERVLVFGRGE